MAKIKTVGTVGEFMANKHRSKATIKSGMLLPLAVAPFAQVTKASAHTEVAVPAMATDQMYDKMVDAFDPLIVLVQAMAYPIATVVVLGGAIMVMINQKEKGYSLMMNAGLGYVLITLTPMILNILVEAMKGL